MISSPSISTSGAASFGPRPSAKRPPLIPSAVFATILVVFTEVMFFSAFISAFVVIKAANINGGWELPANVRLPVLATGFNTLVLFASGFMLLRTSQLWRKGAARERIELSFLASALLGLFFVLFQGYEWVNLIKWGMTLKSGIFSSLFYLIIGGHGLHVAAGVIAMAVLFARMKMQKTTLVQVYAMQIYWFFVVGIWPVLFGLVYF